MRNFALSDAAASELWSALNASTASTPQATAAPLPAPTGPPTSASAAPYVSEQDQIIAGVEYTPAQAGFPDGWPPRDPDQSSATHKDTDYIHTNSKGGPGGGYYTLPGFAERTSKPIPNIHDKGNPYEPPGIWGVIVAVGTPQQHAKALARIQALPGQPDIINANADYDPQWNAALAQLVAGKGVEEIWTIANGDPVKPSFTKDQLAAALQTFYSL